MLTEFRQFLLRGNVVDLAVGVVIGAAFGAVVTSMVEDLITPIIAAVFSQPDFSDLTFTINGSVFRYGSFLNALISFLTIATAVFWLVVVPMNHLIARFRSDTPTDAPTRPCPECLSEVPKAAHRCAFCTTELQPAA